MNLTILLPVYNDWEPAAQVCAGLADAFRGHADAAPQVLLVDDGSTIPIPGGFPRYGDAAGLPIMLLTLRRNVGHQRAIAVGLAYLHDRLPSDAVVVMDADGEDRPADVPRLLEAFEREGGRTMVFAERRRRFAGVTFKLFYWLFRVVHRLLVGRGVKIGNFSIIPYACLSNLVTQSALWSHYAAAAVNSRLPIATVPIDRGSRLGGTSRMNFVSLVAHGLSAISVFREIIATRALVATGSVVILGVATLVAILVVGPARGAQLSASAWLGVMILGVGLLQLLVAALALALGSLAEREQFNVLPARDYQYFVRDCRTLDSR
jgi:glycosyltransferase involved in cell wall biosynthesis